MYFVSRRFLFQFIRMRNRIFFPFVLLYIASCTIIAYFLEPDTYQSYFNAFWWVMTTLTTVGYGDISPVTTAGKSFAIFLYVTGIALIGLTLGRILNLVSYYEKLKEEGKMSYTGKNHMVLIGWTTKAEIAIEEILSSDSITDIVIIAGHKQVPYLHHRIHYIQGKATDEETLLKANILKAKGVIIFTHFSHPNQHDIEDPMLLDGKTLLIATSICTLEQRYGVGIHVIAEVVHSKHVEMFKHVKVDEFILSQEATSHMAVRSLFTHGVSRLHDQMISQQSGENIYQIQKRPHWNNYKEAFLELLEEGATLIADGEDMKINLRLYAPIPSRAELYIMCTEETYEKIKKRTIP